MNAFEPLVWMACVWCIVARGESTTRRYGSGSAFHRIRHGNEIRHRVFCRCRCDRLVLTRNAGHWHERIRDRRGIAFLSFFCPNLIWVIRHDFPFLELMHNHPAKPIATLVRIRSRSSSRTSPDHESDSVSALVGGLLWLFLGRRPSVVRVSWIVYGRLAARLIAASRPKTLSRVSIYPLASLRRRVGSKKLRPRAGMGSPLLCNFGSGIAMNSRATGVSHSFQRARSLIKETRVRAPKAETNAPARCRNYFADESVGKKWRAKRRRVYNHFRPKNRRDGNFREQLRSSGSIGFLRPRLGLPNRFAITKSYWLWGARDTTAAWCIVLGVTAPAPANISRASSGRPHQTSVLSPRRGSSIFFLCRGLTGDLRQSGAG